MANQSILAAFERMWQHVTSALGNKSDISHNHDDMYYTETEVDTKISAVNTSISNITNGTTTVKEAEHAISADSATTAASATSATKATQDGNGEVISSTYETKTDASAKLTEAKSYTDTVASGKADSNHNHDEDYDAKGTAEEKANAVQTNLDAVSSELAEHIDNADIHFTATERTKLSGIAAGAQKNTITGVKGNSESSYRTGDVNITKANIGLGNVDNTSDTNKPVSTAQQTAIDTALTSAKEYTDDAIADEVTNRDSAIATAKSSAISTASSDATTKADEALATAKSYTDTKTSNLASTTVVDNKISTHNASTSAHSDIRALITDLTTKLNAFLDVDDTTTDQLSEVLTLIENNKGTLESLTTSKVNVSDIVDNLTTSNTSKVLSANQGVVIKTLIDTLQTELDEHTHSYAGSSSAGGAATSANKLNTDAGSTTQPVYFADGVPKATTYTLNKSVPSNAVFTDTHYTSKNVVGAVDAISNTSTALSNGAVYLNSVENGEVTSSHKISGSGATTVTTDASGNIVISSTDNNTTYSAAGSSLGLVKSGGDVTISSGVITVNDDSHNHTIANVDNLQSSLDSINEEIDGCITGLSVSGQTITYTKGDGTTGTIKTQDTNTTYSSLKNPNALTVKGNGTSSFTYDGSAAKTLNIKAGSNVSVSSDTSGNITISSTDTNTTYSAATTSANGLMTAAMVTKLNGIATGANAYSLPTATSSVLGGVKTGSNITNSSGTISLTKANVTSALGYTPPTTNTTYSAATTSAAGLMSASDKSKLDGITASADTVSFSRSLTSGTKIGTITINGTGTDLYCQTNTNTTYSQATSSTLGLVKIGYTESGKNYPVELNSSGQMYVNVPWTDTNTNTTYSAGTGISLSGTTFSNSGVRSVATGSSNGTISVNTNGTTANVAVKGLGSAAYTASTAYAAASHTHSYLPLSGGTVTGDITMSGANVVIPNGYSVIGIDTSGNRGVMCSMSTEGNLSIGSPAATHVGNTNIYAPNGEINLVNANKCVLTWTTYDGDSFTNYFRCNTDAAAGLGTTSSRWYRLYQSASSVSTSDEREKSDIMSISDYPVMYSTDSEGNVFEQVFNKLVPKTYTLNVENSGDLHIGFIAQDIVAALEELGLSEDDLGLVVHDYWTDEETGEERDRYGLAYEEFIALNTYVIQKQQTKIATLEERIALLEESIQG